MCQKALIVKAKSLVLTNNLLKTSQTGCCHMCCRAVKIFRIAFSVDLNKVLDPNAIHITHKTDQVLQMTSRSQNLVKIKEKSFSTFVFVLLLCLFIFFFRQLGLQELVSEFSRGLTAKHHFRCMQSDSECDPIFTQNLLHSNLTNLFQIL